MKLLRVGEFGKEIPAILDSENKIRDLSNIIQDFCEMSLDVSVSSQNPFKEKVRFAPNQILLKI